MKYSYIFVNGVVTKASIMEETTMNIPTSSSSTVAAVDPSSSFSLKQEAPPTGVDNGTFDNC